MERRDADYFHQWLLATKEEEKQRNARRAKNAQPEEFKALGSGGEEDEEAWEQWFGYVDWLAEDRPDDLEHSRIGGLREDEEDEVPVLGDRDDA